MKNRTNVYVLLLSLFTSTAIYCMDDQIKALITIESKIFKAERKAIQDEMNPNRYRKESAMSYFTQKAFEEASRDAKDANSVRGYKRENKKSNLENPNRMVVGSAAWAISKK